MRTSVKILLGLATLSPFAFGAAFIACFFYLVKDAPVVGFEEYFQAYMPIFNLAGLLFTAYYVVILVIFIVHAANNPNLEATGMRTTWLVTISIFGPWVMPFYWFHHIWRDGTPFGETGPLGLN